MKPMTRDSAAEWPGQQLRGRIRSAVTRFGVQPLLTDYDKRRKTVVFSAAKNIIDLVKWTFHDAIVVRFGFERSIPEIKEDLPDGTYFIELRFPDSG